MRAEPARLLARRLARLVTGLVAGLVLLTACSEGASMDVVQDRSDPAPTGRSTGLPAVASYVALGDSFTSAPFVPSTDLADGCFRSDGNYPSLLAERLGPERFVDVSCAAARTADVTGPQLTAAGRGRVPPQLRAVSADTELVTIGIGPNDGNIFARVAQGCATSPAGRCQELLTGAGPVLTRMGDSVAAVLRRISRAAPDAEVILVGYPRLTAPDRPCPLLPMPTDALDDVASFEVRLNRVLRAAARDAGTAYVDMHAVSAGHEICSEQPWVNGSITDDSKALAYHPFAAGQRAVADQVARVLQRRATR